MFRGQKVGGLYWTTIRNFLAFLCVLRIFAQSIAGLSHRGQNASVYEQVAGDLEESVPNTSSPSQKYVRVPGAGQSHGGTSDDGDERDDEDDGGVTQETEPMEITPLMHLRKAYGPDGRVVVDAVDDSGEHRQPHVVVVPHRSSHRIPNSAGTTGRRDRLVDRPNDPQCSHPRTARLRNYSSPTGCVASDLD